MPLSEPQNEILQRTLERAEQVLDEGGLHPARAVLLATDVKVLAQSLGVRIVFEAVGVEVGKGNGSRQTAAGNDYVAMKQQHARADMGKTRGLSLDGIS